MSTNKGKQGGMAETESKVDSSLSGLTKWLSDLSAQLPQFPKSVTDFFVKYLGVINIVLGILSVFTVFLLLTLAGFGAVLGAFTFGAGFIVTIIALVATAIVAVQAYLFFMSYSPLQEKKLKGWKYTYWAHLIGVVSAILTLFIGRVEPSNFFGLLLSLVLLHLVLQIRKEYK